ncbi:MAG: hypothetical protein K9H49_10020 [Bacteroidales bacterium]|nr:hypothetical protein [Bacteroidales bacterium]MCF8389688.1 hypothetical protein [Bacteroidales bacterium]
MEKKNNNLSYLITLLVVLTIALMVIGYLFYTQKKESESVIAKLEEYSGLISSQKDSLESELKGIIVQYDSLMTENDTMNLKLAMQQDKIERLLKLRLSDAQKIRAYEKELGTIRGVLRSYIVQIDSLNTMNKELIVENVALRSHTAKVETINKQLSEDKEELISITNEAKTLVAANILGVGLNKRSKDTNRFKLVEKVRVDFILRKNSVTQPGPKMIYLRLIRPDNLVLSPPKPAIIIVNGEEMPYSANREVIYENNDVPVSIFWDNNGDLVGGNYIIELFENGKLIGSSEFALK